MHLRLFKPSDIKPLFEWFPDEASALQWAGANMRWPLERRQMTQLIKRHRGQRPTRETWAVMDDGGEMIGHAQIALQYRLKTAHLGRIALSPNQRGKGRAQVMVQLILDQAFSHAWVHRCDLMVYAHNHAAIAAYQRAGFVTEGRKRDTTPIGERVWDTLIMSLLRPEYEHIKYNVFDKRTEHE